MCLDDKFQYDVFVICPVRNAKPEEKEFLEKYVSSLETEGFHVYLPHRDTNQDDLIGLRICEDNRRAIHNSAKISVYWNPESQGSLFDLGMSFMIALLHDKPIYLINRDDVKPTPHKSFQNVLLALDDKYRMRK